MTFQDSLIAADAVKESEVGRKAEENQIPASTTQSLATNPECLEINYITIVHFLFCSRLIIEGSNLLYDR